MAFRNGCMISWEDNQIQLINNSIIVIAGNQFSGIGGIVTTDGAGVKFTLIDNSFRATSASPVFYAKSNRDQSHRHDRDLSDCGRQHI
jgi:hypothetical protein